MSNSNPGFLADAKVAQTLYIYVNKLLFFFVALLTWLQVFFMIWVECETLGRFEHGHPQQEETTQ